MEIISRFSLQDFLAYFFPGISAVLGVYLLLLLTPAKDFFTFTSIDLTLAILLSALAYTAGVILSGISEPIAMLILKARAWEEPRASIPLPELEEDILSALKDVLGIAPESELRWSGTHFYLCRSLVQEAMPNCAQAVFRQVGLGQLRENMLAPILVWCAVGLAWGMRTAVSGSKASGVVVVVGSLVLTLIFLASLTRKMHSSRKRAVREVCTAFLAGYRMQRFAGDKKKELVISHDGPSLRGTGSRPSR